VRVGPYARAAGIGAVAGLRTFTAPAATLAAGGSVWTGLVTALAAGEYVGDKLPGTPSRLAAGPLIARIVSGAACGRALAARNDGNPIGGMLAGGAAAVAGAYAGYHLRHYLTSDRKLPDLPLALLEDAVAIVGARAAASRRLAP
jgi:uncharacterized membrane protein